MAADGPAWTIIDSGHTTRGWPWYRVRKAGGQEVRLTVHGANATPGAILEAIERATANLPARPGPDVF